MWVVVEVWKNDEQDMWDTAGKTRMNSFSTFSHRLLHSVGWPPKTYLYQLCTDIQCSLEDLAGIMDGKKIRWTLCCLCDLMMTTCKLWFGCEYMTLVKNSLFASFSIINVLQCVLYRWWTSYISTNKYKFFLSFYPYSNLRYLSFKYIC